MLEQLQRTAEWLEKRKGRVTGSIAGAALGLCSWRKPEDVIRQMVREHHGLPSEFEAQFVADFGKTHERAAFLAFMRKTGLEVIDVGFSPYEDWCGASPDGITSDDAVLEIKVPYSLRNDNPAAFKTLEERQDYYAQVQVEMISTEKKRAYFYQYVPEQGDMFSSDYVAAQDSLEEVHYDAEWVSENFPKLRDFYDWYLSEIDNPEHLEPKRVEIETNEAQSIVNRIDEIDDHLAAMTEERKDAIKKLVDMAGGKNALICGRKLTLVKRKGNIDYKKAIDPSIDLEQFRKPGSESWRFS